MNAAGPNGTSVTFSESQNRFLMAVWEQFLSIKIAEVSQDGPTVCEKLTFPLWVIQREGHQLIILTESFMRRLHDS